ncbi:hypothetical protein ACOSP7_000221 [Xanthoceras sorbifolium]
MGIFIRLPTAQAIWEAVARTYYDGADQSIIYELNIKVFHIRQSGRPISEYYGEFNTIWQELDQRCPNDMTDATDVVRLNDRIEKQRVYMFLAGLDPAFDKVQADVLRMDPFPGAQRQATMLALPQVSDCSALLINKGNLGDRKCTHCGQKNHIRDACWRLIGYHEWYLEKRKKGPLKTGTASLASSSGNLSSTPHGNTCDSQIQFSNSGIFHSAFSVSTISSNNTWIIDSGATDHMTFNSQNFSHRSPTETNNVSYADGTPTPVFGAGSIPLTSSLNLSSVLHMPTLSNNLLSISQITKFLNCVVTFWHSHCVFQDTITKDTIGIGREKGGLYYFTTDSVSSHPHRVVQVRADNESNIFLWHRRLGHCSFGYLKFLFPSLFKTIGRDNLQV